MKIEYFENKYGLDIQFVAETVEEASALSRVGLNVKSEKPFVRVYFPEKGSPTMSVWIKKVNGKVQRNSIGN